MIDKINMIQNQEFIEALDVLINSSASADELIELDKYQIAMLEMSEQDIKDGKVISHQEVIRKNRNEEAH